MTKNDLPKISVVMPVKNAVKTIDKAISSLISQNYPNLEFIVLDAASNDGTVEIIKKYENYISFWRSHPDSGTAAAHNEGIDRSTGDIVCFLNADDWYENDVLLEVGKTFLESPEFDVVSFEAQMVSRDKKNQNGFKLEKYFPAQDMKISTTSRLAPNARFFSARVFRNHKKFVETCPLDQKPMIAIDLEFIIRLAVNGVNEKVIPKLGYTYLSHSGSLTMGKNKNTDNKIAIERMWVASLYLNHPNIDAKGRRRLARWHRKGSVIAAYQAIKERGIKKAIPYFKEGLSTSPLAWLPCFLWLIVRRSNT